MRSLTEPVVWTNLLFFLNALMWCAADLWYTGAFVAVTGLASLTYHILHESEPISSLVDRGCARAALIWTLWVSVDALNVQYAVAVAVALAAGLWLKARAHRGSYEAPHTLWHVCVFVGQATLALACGA